MLNKWVSCFLVAASVLALPTASFAYEADAPALYCSECDAVAHLPRSFWYVGVEGGWVNFSSSESTDTIQLYSGLPDHEFSAGSAMGALYGANAGYSFLRHGAIWFPAIYTGVDALQSTSITPEITHTYPFYSTPNVSTGKLTFDFLTVLLNASVDFFNWRGLAPFIGGGVGWGNVTLKGFTEGSVSGADPYTPWTFANNTSQVLTYDLSFGLRYRLGVHWQTQLSYMYLALGNINTGAGTTSVISTAPLSIPVHTNNALLAINYLF